MPDTSLIWFIVLYLGISVGIGLYAATRVHNTKDFAVAGRSLPLPVVIATVFATWFGAEAVFGVSAQFVKEGLGGVVADPFGSSMCLILAGFLFAMFLYKLNIITLGDFYRMRYNRTVEVITSLCIVVSYLGWVAAQIKAMGLIFAMVTNGGVSQEMGMIIGAAIVLTYTVFGGMFSVAILDFVQMIVTMGGLLFIAWTVSGMTGGVAPVIAHASEAGKFQFFPKGDIWVWITFIGTWMTMMLGSIPQQDVFQRITSAKSAKIAIWGSVIGASIYFFFTFVPMFIAYSATVIDPKVFGALVTEDSQKVLPTLVLNHMPLAAQALFFGAVLSAIMSCSSATLLAPSVTFAENIVKGFFPGMTDKKFLLMMRCTLVGFTCIVLLYALNAQMTIFGMVESAYKITLAGAFVPLVFGIFWKRSTTQGALFATLGGLVSWILIEVLIGEKSPVPPQLIGLCVSAFGMVVGSLIPQFYGNGDEGYKVMKERAHHHAHDSDPKPAHGHTAH
jgi:solute:Na+ symporter, SSS family